MDSLDLRIVLASSSPRRKMLLQQLDIPFDIKVSNIDEVIYDNVPAEEFARRLACEKAQMIAHSLTDVFVIGADTIVVDEFGMLGKPQDEQDAFQMLLKVERERTSSHYRCRCDFNLCSKTCLSES